MKIVILAGGAGSRLWPMSTQECPKQFQALVSTKTLLQETYDRVAWAGAENIYISTNSEYAELVKEQLPQVPSDNLILEPCLRDTAPCLGLAAAFIAKTDPEAVMSVVYADHLVQDPEEFQKKLAVAEILVKEENSFAIIEVFAKTPNTGLGYVKIGPKLKEIKGVAIHPLEAFKEKPNLETAKKFLADGNYLWNTGFYVWKVSTLLKAFEDHLPKTHAQLKAIQAGVSIETLYPLCEKISIDYGIMEKIDPSQVKIIPAELGWSDIGTWASIQEELAKNTQDNVTKGKVTVLDGTGNLVYNQTLSPLAVMGIHDSIVVQTAQGTLICPKKDSSKIKDLLQAMDK
jgi:mannose-1-phosphate guanylyltransferase